MTARRGAPGFVRNVVGYLLFNTVLFLAQSVFATSTVAPRLLVAVSVAAAGIASVLGTSALLGPRRTGQLFGPLWIPLGVLYGFSVVSSFMPLKALQWLGQRGFFALTDLKFRLGDRFTTPQENMTGALVFGAVLAVLVLVSG